MHSEDILKAAHKHSIRNKAEILSSTVCGCFYCLEIFSPVHIKELRIPDQSCHLFQPNAATHSISKLPPIPVNAATH